MHCCFSAAGQAGLSCCCRVQAIRTGRLAVGNWGLRGPVQLSTMMQSSGEAREMRPLPQLPSPQLQQAPTTQYMVAPGDEVLSYHAYVGKLRNRVVTVSVITAVCFVLSAVIQLFFGFLSWQTLQKKLDYLAEVEAIPELSSFLQLAPHMLLTSAVPAILYALLAGGLFTLCGMCGARADNECCACCYCCCNACCCVLSIVSLLLSAALINVMSTSSDAAQIWFETCDPTLCYPAGHATDPKMTVDCLAPAVWDAYRPQLDGPHLPQQCPPMYLVCKGAFDEDEPSRARYLKVTLSLANSGICADDTIGT